MEIVDANIILRYLLNDNLEHFTLSKKIIEEKEIHIPFEVYAEVVYVLEKIYHVKRIQIQKALTSLNSYSNIQTNNKSVIHSALILFSIHNLDFVDTLLLAYARETKAKIHTFDKKLLKLCSK